MKKTVFVLKIDNVIDIITNSSSELFVLKADSAEIVKELLASIYPGYLNEYREPIQPKDMDPYDLESYLEWVNGWEKTRKNCVVYEGFTFDEMYDPYPYPNAWDKEPKFIIKRGFIEENAEVIVNLVDPGNKTWLLYSIHENPDYEMQEKLETVAQRYHLG